MKASLKNIILFFILFILLDSLSGVFISQNFYNIKFGTIGKINTSLKSDVDIIVLGSSRAMYHYDPRVISYNTGYTCYNAGLGGYGLFYNYALLSELIKKNKPKIALLDLSPNVINDKKSYEKINLFVPYKNNYDSFNELMKLNPNYHFLSRLSSLYKYNSTFYDHFRNMVSPTTETDGFFRLSGEIDLKSFSAFYYDNSPLDTIKILYFNKIIKICKDNDIRLICLISPTFVKYDTSNIIISKYNEIAAKEGIEYLDESSLSPFYLNPSYFKDQLHLNQQGAMKYSSIISNYIVKSKSNSY